MRQDVAHLRQARVHNLTVASRVGEKNALGVDIRPVAQMVGNVLGEHGGKLAAVLFPHGHPAVPHEDAWLEVEQVGAQRRHGGAAAALVQKLQTVDHERGIHIRHQPDALQCDLRRTLALLGHFSRVDHQQSAARAEVARVDHEDVVKVLRSKAGVVERGGKLRADGKENDGIALLRVLPEKAQKLGDVDRGGLGQLPGLCIVAIDAVRIDIHAVGIGLLAQRDTQRNDFDMITLDQLRRKVRRAVACDQDFFAHGSFLPRMNYKDTE